MSRKVTLIMSPGRNTIRFPNKCVYCGKTGTLNHACQIKSQKTLSQTSSGLEKQRTYLEYDLTMNVPYCPDHLRITKNAKTVMAIAGVIGFLLGGFAAFQILNQFSEVSDSTVGWVGAALCLAGLFSGPVVAKLVAQKLVNPAYKDVSVWAYWNGGTYTLGLKAFTFDEKVDLTFLNDVIGEEFAKFPHKTK